MIFFSRGGGVGRGPRAPPPPGSATGSNTHDDLVIVCGLSIILFVVFSLHITQIDNPSDNLFSVVTLIPYVYH